tara:strand:- start:4175 stop:4420 length:246 start_codon:yes stop_codon:yes gene_type:complete
MAYSASALLKVAGGAKGIFFYSSTDALSTIVGSGYFNNATAELKEHDIIIAVGSTGGTETVDMLLVTSASGAATVTTHNGT